MVSLNSKDGKERWRKKVADEKIAVLLHGVASDHQESRHRGGRRRCMDMPGFLEARDPETGDVQWRWNTTPRKGEPGADTWPNPQAMEHGGGMTWMPGPTIPN